MPIIVLPLREIVLDPENPVDLTALPPEQAIELIKESYGFLSNATDISIESGVLTIHLPDEDAQRIDEAAKWFRHGVKHAESGDYRRAIQLFRRTLERLPNHVEARRNLAMAYLESREEEQAKKLLIETLRLDPKDAWSYLLLGNIFAKHDRKSDVAEKYYRRAFELNPRDAILLANYGALMVERGNREQAEEFFERAIEANPSYPNAYYALALLDEQDNHPEKGLSVLGRLFAESKPFDSRGLALMNEARKLYLEINRQIAEQAYDELMALIEEKKGEIERQSGYPIQVVQDNSLQTVSAVSQMAWKHSWKEHRIRYRLKHRAFTPHLIAHELMHIRFEQAAREAGKNRHFTTTAQTQELALRSVRDYVSKLRDQGYKESVITEALRQMVGGLTNQLFNTPLDMMIEKALYDNWPKLRPSQFASVHAIYREGLEAFTNKDIKRITPPSIFKANTGMNIALALFLDDLYGERTDYARAYASSDMMSLGKRLFALWRESKAGSLPGAEYELVDEYARILKLQDWFEWKTESDAQARSQVDLRRSSAPGPSPQGITNPELMKAKQPAAVMYLLDTLQRFERLSEEDIKQIGMETGIRGMEGIDYLSSDKRYTLRAFPGETFSGLQMLCFMYVAFKHIDPSADTGINLKEAYETALKLHEDKSD